jgi:hypothetical protein
MMDLVAPTTISYDLARSRATEAGRLAELDLVCGGGRLSCDRMRSACSNAIQKSRAAARGGVCENAACGILDRVATGAASDPGSS